MRAPTRSAVENVAGAHPEPASPVVEAGMSRWPSAMSLPRHLCHGGCRRERSDRWHRRAPASARRSAGVLGELGGTVGWAHRGRDGPLPAQLGLRVRWLGVPVGVVGGITTQLVLVPALYLPLRGLTDEDALSAPARKLFDGIGGIELAVLGLMVVVVAPIVEEVFFRGAVLHALRRRWRVAAAVAASSVVFGATHFQPLQLPALALAGAVFAVAVVRTGRLGAAIAVHAGFNATTFVTLALLQ